MEISMLSKINRLLTSCAVKNPIRSIGILVGFVSTVVGGAAAAQFIPDPEEVPGFFKIVNSGSGRCLERNGDGLGEPILQQDCVENALDPRFNNQLWVQSPATDKDGLKRFQIASRLPTNLCLDVRDGANADRTVVQQWECNLHHPSKRWEFHVLVPNTFFKLRSEIGRRCLDVAGGSLEPGAQIQIFRCTEDNSNTAQIWEARAVDVMGVQSRR
jgi:hypothetical protein